MVSFWADEYTLRGDKMKGQDMVRWKKEVYSRIQELDEIFKEDEKLKKEGEKWNVKNIVAVINVSMLKTMAIALAFGVTKNVAS